MTLHKFPLPSADAVVPILTTTQMIEVDRLMIEDYGITLVQMMENAGRALAQVARLRFLDGDPEAKRVVILAGTGGNGGGAMVCARRLANYGANVFVHLTKPVEQFEGIPRHQLDILLRMGITVQVGIGVSEDYPQGVPTGAELQADVGTHRSESIDLVIDGVIGYSLESNPHGEAANLIRWANQHDAPTLSLDVPSGVDTGSGVAFEPAVRAAATVTLALPKTGLFGAEVAEHIGELYLADISVPPGLYASPTIGLTVGPVFRKSDILRIR